MPEKLFFKNYSMPLTFRKTQTGMTLKFRSTSVRIAEIMQTTTIRKHVTSYAGMDEGKWEHLTAGRRANWCSHYRNWYGVYS